MLSFSIGFRLVLAINHLRRKDGIMRGGFLLSPPPPNSCWYATTLAAPLRQWRGGSRMYRCVINCSLCCAYCILWPASITVIEHRFVAPCHVSEHICVLETVLQSLSRWAWWLKCGVRCICKSSLQPNAKYLLLKLSVHVELLIFLVSPSILSFLVPLKWSGSTDSLTSVLSSSMVLVLVLFSVCACTCIWEE